MVKAVEITIKRVWKDLCIKSHSLSAITAFNSMEKMQATTGQS